MSGHTPWREIRHKRDERKAKRREELTRALQTTATDIVLEQVQQEYGITFKRYDYNRTSAWIWSKHPVVPHDHAYYVSNLINEQDYMGEQTLYHHERVGLFGGTAFPFQVPHFSAESFQRDLSREFFISMRKAAKDLRDLDLPKRLEESLMYPPREFDL